MSAQQPLDSHMNFRMTHQDKKVIEKAAKLKGLKSNTYARKILVEAAEKDILEMEHVSAVYLNQEQWENFVKIMEQPTRAHKNFKKAAQRYKEMFE